MVARICLEAGGRVATNVLVRELDLVGVPAADGRRLRMPMIADRLPQVAAHVVGTVTNEEVPTGCLGELKDAAAQLDRAGSVLRPDWASLRDGARPPVSSAEPGEWQHEWQFSMLPPQHHFRKTNGAVTCVPSGSGSFAVTLSSWELQPTSNSD